MFRDRDKEGLSRQERLDAIRTDRPFRVMEDDFFHLAGRVLDNTSCIRYFNAKNIPDGYWEELYKNQPLIILLEILLFDTVKRERDFDGLKFVNDRRLLYNELQIVFEQWEERLSHFFTPRTPLLLTHLRLQTTIWAQSESLTKGNTTDSGIDINDNEYIRLNYYKALDFIRDIQNQSELYFHDIEVTGEVDPSVAILIAFIKNYRKVVSKYNKRWEQLPEYYLDKILHVTPRCFLPWTTWLVLEMEENTDTVHIPAHTAFIAGKQKDDISILFRNEKDCYASRMQIEKVLAYYFEDVLLRSDLSDYINPEDPSKVDSKIIFQNDVRAEVFSVGIMLESSLLFMKEGVRQIFVTLDLCEKNGLEDSEKTCIPENLNDAFFPEISTLAGWNTIEDYTLLYDKEKNCLNFQFRLPLDYPAIEPCSEIHGIVTQAPAIRLLMNAEATCYPYKWMADNRFERIHIRVDVSEIIPSEVLSVLGQADSSQPFFPFGAMPEQNDWLVWKNEEIARKKVKEVCLKCSWLQLPASELGFYDVYKKYVPPLDNSSFKVRKEYLSQNKWIPVSVGNDPLFSFVAAKGKVERESSFTWSAGGDAGFDGSFRLVLAEPAIGFGHVAFRKLFNECVLRNTFRKKKEELPEVPITPLIDSVYVSYTAEEEISTCAGGASSIAFYYVHPLLDDCLRKVTLTAPPLLYEGVSNKRNLLLGISGAIGETFIRFLVDLAPFERAVRRNNFQIVWFIKKKQWHWERLSPETVRTDTTDCFLQTGLIELQLTEPVSNEWLDENGLCWICAAFKDAKEKEEELSPVISGFYMNVLQVTLDTGQPGFDEKQLPSGFPVGTIRQVENVLPGISGVMQIVDAFGGGLEESGDELKVRIANRISNRDRAVTKRDYEELVLTNFGEVGKVYCLVEREAEEAEAVAVSLVVIPLVYEKGKYPLCENSLLWRVEDFMKEHTSPFVKLYVRNPFYEEVTVRCRIKLMNSDIPRGEVERELVQRINHCIAPWQETNVPPLFSHSFGLDDMKNVIANSPLILSVTDLVVLHRTSVGMFRYHLECVYDCDKKPARIKAYYAGNILFPAQKHLIYMSKDEKEGSPVGIGELKIGNTFIIDIID